MDKKKFVIFQISIFIVETSSLTPSKTLYVSPVTQAARPASPRLEHSSSRLEHSIFIFIFTLLLIMNSPSSGFSQSAVTLAMKGRSFFLKLEHFWKKGSYYNTEFPKIIVNQHLSSSLVRKMLIQSTRERFLTRCKAWRMS